MMKMFKIVLHQARFFFFLLLIKSTKPIINPNKAKVSQKYNKYGKLRSSFISILEYVLKLRKLNMANSIEITLRKGFLVSVNLFI